MSDYEYLIHLLYCAIHDTPPQEKPDSVSFERVLSIAREHEVAPLAFQSVERLAAKPPEAVYQQWQLQYFFAIQRDARQTAVRNKVVTLLHQNGIRTLEAQGTVTKTLYPSPELRMMSDIDIIVDPENQGKAYDLLETAAEDVYRQAPEEFTAVFPGEMMVEIHTDYFTEMIYDRKASFAEAVSNPFAHAIEKAGEPLSFVLEDTYFYLYSVLHTIKHFETAGCGIRRIMDLYYLKKAYTGKIDEPLVKRAIAENGFQESYDALFALEGLWFENTPSALPLTEAVEIVLSSGNHGNKEVFVRNSIKKDKQEQVKLARTKRVLSFLFPTKNYMYINYPQCRERGYHWLTCWCYRLVHKLKHGRLSYAWRYLKTILHS